jgi:hypothetical protein
MKLIAAAAALPSPSWSPALVPGPEATGSAAARLANRKFWNRTGGRLLPLRTRQGRANQRAMDRALVLRLRIVFVIFLIFAIFVIFLTLGALPFELLVVGVARASFPNRGCGDRRFSCDGTARAGWLDGVTSVS